MPKICCGLDKRNFKEISQIINKIFKNRHIKIFVHNNEVNLKDTFSILAQRDENESDPNQTIHSDDENELNNVI